MRVTVAPGLAGEHPYPIDLPNVHAEFVGGLRVDDGVRPLNFPQLVFPDELAELVGDVVRSILAMVGRPIAKGRAVEPHEGEVVVAKGATNR